MFERTKRRAGNNEGFPPEPVMPTAYMAPRTNAKQAPIPPSVEPYYQDELVTLYHGDCRDWDGTADALITDPPYGVNLKTKTNDFRDSAAYDRGKESQLASVLYRDDPEHIRALIQEVIPSLLARVERALIFSGPAMLFAYPEPRNIGAVFNGAGAGRCSWGFQCSWPILYYGKDPFLQDGKGGRPNSFQATQPNRQKFDHPCPKPLPWMEWAVNRASRIGETILDPFAGSGTTLIAAKTLGRKSIGIEVEERYCEIAAKRCAEFQQALAV